MSLTDVMEAFYYQTKTVTPSPLGGDIETWVDGAAFVAAVALDTSMEMRIGYQNGLKKQYTIALPDGVTLTQYAG